MSAPPLSRRRALACLASWLAASPLLRSQSAPQLHGEPPGRIAPADELVNTLEFAAMAERSLSAAAFAAIADGDRSAFDRITFRPRLMVNAQQLDLSVEVLGTPLFAPILAGPAAEPRRFHATGALGLAAGASAAKTTLVLAEQSEADPTEVRAAADRPIWFQAYPAKDATAVVARVQQALESGAKALVLTVGDPRFPAAWSGLAEIRKRINAPVALKGVMRAEDARQAADLGFDAVIISNQGMEPAAGLAAPIAVLPGIAETVGDQLPLLIDGGFRRGSDVLKALAFGARAVLVTRPLLWGLAAYGEAGVRTVLELLQTELASDMAMLGAPNVASIRRDHVKLHSR